MVGYPMAITASVTSAVATTVLVDVEVYSSTGVKVHQQWFDSQTFAAGQKRDYPVTWNVPAGTPYGTYTVKIGVFTVGWGHMYAWNDSAKTVTVAQYGLD
jgi:hypothetical protein